MLETDSNLSSSRDPILLRNRYEREVTVIDSLKPVLALRFKDKQTGNNRFVHMLNGTAIAVSRTLIALIENGQRADGSIRLPSCLGIPEIPAPGA